MSKRNRVSKEDLRQNPDLQDLVSEADKLHDIKTLYDTEGGKQIVNLLLKDVVSVVHTITNAEPKDMPQLAERLKASLNLVRLFVKAGENEEHLDSLIADALVQ